MGATSSQPTDDVSINIHGQFGYQRLHAGNWERNRKHNREIRKTVTGTVEEQVYKVVYMGKA